VVQTNASSSEELASTSEELSAQAAELKNRISFFQIDNDSNHHKSETKFPKRDQHKQAQNAHNTSRASLSLTTIDKHPKAIKDVSVADPKNGIALDMGDDDDNSFQRL
jgi:methyl-accepting chemotaxis protein